jgi:hypothetical protein
MLSHVYFYRRHQKPYDTIRLEKENFLELIKKK